MVAREVSNGAGGDSGVAKRPTVRGGAPVQISSRDALDLTGLGLLH